jgi:hypothetical protein
VENGSKVSDDSKISELLLAAEEASNFETECTTQQFAAVSKDMSRKKI